jgi:hypothetical protein
MTGEKRSPRRRLLRPLAYASIILGVVAILSINANLFRSGPSDRALMRAAGHATDALREVGLLAGWHATATPRSDPPMIGIECRPIDADGPASIPRIDTASEALRGVEPPVPVRIVWHRPGRAAVTWNIAPDR